MEEKLKELIETQQKEIEELLNENINLKEEKMIDKSSCKPLNNFYDYYDCIPKSKIEEKIEEIKKDIIKTEEETHGRCILIDRYAKIVALEELLESEE